MKQRVKFVPNYIQPDNQSTNNMLKCSFEELEKEFTTVHEDALEREKKLESLLARAASCIADSTVTQHDPNWWRDYFLLNGAHRHRSGEGEGQWPIS